MNRENLKKTAKVYFDKNKKLEKMFATESGHFFFASDTRLQFMNKSEKDEKAVDFVRSDFEGKAKSKPKPEPKNNEK